MLDTGKVECWEAQGAAEPVGALQVPAIRRAPIPSPEAAGACQTWSDAVLLSSQVDQLTTELHRCMDGCASAIDPVSCADSCGAEAVASGLSEECAACLEVFEGCDGAACYDERNACIGYNPDFVQFHTENHCVYGYCDGSRRALAQSCRSHAECDSLACAVPSYLSAKVGVQPMCLLPLGSTWNARACGYHGDGGCFVTCGGDRGCEQLGPTARCIQTSGHDAYWCAP